ncbi:MAG TPA: hypothetical protein PK147_07945 [Saprospiraceae bacterium]|nr:hypothetical protein [Saprospiraceae bacterium]MCB9327640.1 hypothetical protein [Lewinellaceae bacterium]HPQ21767.1 hypothetical protein [Saprospiraceae bacterium]HRX29853.1 hypothetical protein [Saprospiraceae bacterium]
MTLKQLIKLEDKAKEVWVVSPELHYDIENKDFTELVSVNLGQKTKYRYIVPATKEIEKNIKSYQKKYKLTDEEVHNNFLLLPENEFLPFVMETAIYDASTDCIACAAPAMEDTDDVIKLSSETAKMMAKKFSQLWKTYKRVKP